MGLTIGLLVNTGYAQDDGSANVIFAPDETVKIGVGTDLSNRLPEFGLDMVQAVLLAVSQFNEADRLEGFQVEVDIQDDLCITEGAALAAQEFVDAGDVIAVVGHLCSDASIAASEIYEEARIPMVSPASTAGYFTARGLDVVNRTVFNDNIQGYVAAGFIHEVLEAERIMVLHNQTSYGEGLADTLALTFELLGGEVLAFEAIDPEAEDYADLLDEIAVLEPDLVYLGGYIDEGARLIEQIRLSGMEDLIFFSDDGIYGQDFIARAAEFSEGAYATFGTQEGDPEANEEFDGVYEMEYGVVPDDLGPYHGQSYDATNVILNALAEVAEVDDDGNLVIDREAMIKAVRSTADYEGLSGTITCDEFGDCGTALISVYQVQDGAWVEIDVPSELQVQP